ncbi:hypothetical protein C8F04DRAFT_1393052 [Mycena alexandri]|uniref:Uncharacterized protein n=1 Tax=Mycena alexandri TaxID=1745969 RepID=A0AAD6T6D8_9AGAR|nr:hypothetical protein C8F04DRAFT_1393052 [Mycena alexandri]
MTPTPPSPSFPGPVPGAWPSSQHRRSTTCPTPRPVVDPLHLEHVLDFQSRLVSQMAKPETPPSASFAASVSAGSAIAVADSLDSELTRFRTDTSTSIATDTSVSTTFTSRSSPERLVTAKLPLTFKTKYPPVENRHPTRIPRPTNAVRSTSDQTPARNRTHRQNVFSSDSPSPPHAQRASLLTVDISPSSSFSMGGPTGHSPVSPMIFASPTSSSFPRLITQSSPHNRSSSYEYTSSPSWETSYGSEYNDRDMLNPSPSPSPSPMSGRPNLVARPLSSANRTPSIEISAALPMLTSLSLPASPDTSMSLDMDPIVSRSPRLSPIDGDASPWTLSLSPASPVLSIVPDLSLSSPAAGNTVDGHVVSFPSPSSSSSPFVSPLPSPLLDSITEAYVGDTSGAEYAAAIMSSAWASEGPSLTQAIPPALRSTEENETPSPVFSNADVEQSALASEEEELPGPLAYQENVPLGRQQAKVGGVIGKMKKFSDKFKKLLRGKAKISRDNGGVNIDVDVRRAGSSPLPNALPDVIDIQGHTSVAQAYNSLLSYNDTDRLPLPLPPPPGLVLRKSKTRPILSSQTYNSTLTRRTNDNTTRQITPAIRIRPPSSSSNIAISNNNNNAAPKTPSPDLTVHARPKTLAEIKSKRRLSLSALSNFTRSPSPAPPVNIVTSNRHRARPASALAFYPRPPTPSSVRGIAQVDRTATPRRSLQVPRSVSSREISTAAFRGTVRSNSTQAHASMAPLPLPQPMADTIKKKNRRFSLSALSSFAVGEGSWQRSGGLRDV